MSEKKEEEFLNKIKEVMNQVIEAQLKKPAEKPKESSTTSSESKEDHKHWKAEDISDTCPECIAEKDKIGKAYQKKVAQASKNLEYECMECGTHFGKKDKKCPTCGKTEVRRI